MDASYNGIFQPGETGGTPYYKIGSGKETCKNLLEALEHDKIRRKQGNCPAGYYEIVLVIDPDKKDDYHFYRGDGPYTSGTPKGWSGKMGSYFPTDKDAAGKSISHPRKANKRYGGPYGRDPHNFSQVCGTLCVPAQGLCPKGDK